MVFVLFNGYGNRFVLMAYLVMIIKNIIIIQMPKCDEHHIWAFFIMFVANKRTGFSG